MNILWVSAILFGAILPCPLPEISGIKEACAVVLEDAVFVAVIPDGATGYEGKSASLQEAADRIAEENDRCVILTEDLLTYLTLLRMRKRGADEYERRNLLSRLDRIRENCYYGKTKMLEEG